MINSSCGLIQRTAGANQRSAGPHTQALSPKNYLRHPLNATLSFLKAVSALPLGASSRAATPLASPAPSTPVLTPDQLQRELNYRVAMTVADRLMANGLLKPSETRKIKQKIAVEFSPIWASIV